MKQVRFAVFFFFCALVAFGVLFALPREVEQVAGAAYYEVQWLRALPGEANAEGPIERFAKGFPDRPPSGYTYYRIRSIGSDGLGGPWSKTYPLTGAPVREEEFALPPSHFMVGRTEYYSLKTAEALKITILTKDTSSGNRYLWVKMNANEFSRLDTGIIELREDGRYAIYWYAEDQVGHKSATESRYIVLDTSGPELSTRVLDSGLTQENEVTSDAKLAILARDDGVGLAGLRWRSTVRETWEKYTGPIPLNKHTTGNHGVIFIHAFDRLGNESPLKTFVFQIQQERPADLPKALGMFGGDESRPVEVPPEGLKVDGLKPGETLSFEMENGDTISAQNGDTVQFPGGKNRVTMKYTDQLGRTVTKVVEIVTDRDPPETDIKLQR